MPTIKYRIVAVVGAGQTCEKMIENLAELPDVIMTLPAHPIMFSVYTITE